MKIPSVQHRGLLAFVVGLAALAFSGWASADPASRVARLAYISGPVSFSPAGEDHWVQATINRPLTSGDRLWSDARARTEIQVAGAAIRMGAETSLAILNLDDRMVQLHLAQGSLNVRINRLGPRQQFEVDTPNLAFTLNRPGEFRITVDPDGNATTIVMRSGQGEAYGDGAAYVLEPRRGYRFSGTGLVDLQFIAMPQPDEFDRWSVERERGYATSTSARYVSPDVLGHQELDAHGTWRVDANYGNVWYPSRVASGWAPYREGHWSWIDPWGWTWIDDAPWGFAVSHYGRWTNVRGNWGWVPGPVRSPAWYAPALVVFLGGDNFRLSVSGGSVGGVGWLPLAPREVYRPAYSVSRGYFDSINRSNTVVNTTVINNYYTNTNVTNIVYANQSVPGAVIAVPATAFVQSQPVARAVVRVDAEAIRTLPLVTAAPVVPTERSVRGAGAAGGKPPAKVFERPVIARTPPPPAPAGFAAQQALLAARPGQPLAEDARKDLKRAPTAPAPVVKLVPQAQQVVPKKVPPAVAQQLAEPKAVPKPMPPQAQAEPKVAPATGAGPEAKPMPPQARGEPKVAPTPAPEPKPLPPQAQAEPKAVPTPRPAPEPRVMPPQARGEPKAVPTPRPAPEPRVMPPQARGEPKAAPTPRPAPEPKPMPPQAQAEPKAAPTPRPAPEPKPMPPQAQAEPKAAPTPRPAPEPRVMPPQARGEPKAAPTPRPAPEPKPMPPQAQAEPKAVPAPKQDARAQGARSAASRAEERGQGAEQRERK